MAKRSSVHGLFTDAQHKAISRAITVMRDRAVNYKQPDLIVQDVLDMFVKPEHHILARDAVSLLETTPTNFIEHRISDPTYEGGRVCVNIHFEWAGGKAMTLPKYAGKEVYRNVEAYEKLLRWARWRLERGREWSMVEAIFRKLHDVAPSMGVALFYVPALANLLGMADDSKLHKIAEQWKRVGVPNNMPTYPRAFKRACADINHVIVKGMLLPPEVKTNKPAVWVDIDTNYTCARVEWKEEGATTLVIHPTAM